MELQNSAASELHPVAIPIASKCSGLKRLQRCSCAVLWRTVLERAAEVRTWDGTVDAGCSIPATISCNRFANSAIGAERIFLVQRMGRRLPKPALSVTFTWPNKCRSA